MTATRRFLGPLCCGLFLAAVCSGSSDSGSAGLATNRYRLDATQSKFIAHAFAGGLLWFKGHEHFVAAREFGGEAQITPDSITPASQHLIVKADSMTETSDEFTEQEKQVINKELKDIVLQPDQYPEIVFTGDDVTGNSLGNGQYDVKIAGDLVLHGVTRRIVIPARVVLTGNNLRASGEFSINRSDYNVKATSAVHGLVRVRDNVRFMFDIVGHRI